MTTDDRHVAERGPDTHEMVVIHRAFRRESDLLARLVAAVPAGDTERARVLADHLRWYQAGLHSHHHGEDELIWPLLHARVDVHADVVVRMEEQHQQITRTLQQAMAALPAWQAAASGSTRDRLVAALADHRAVLVEHLDDEEIHLLPLAGRHLTQDEWNALGEHFVATASKSQRLIFLGAVLEDADPAERSTLLGAMPAAARIVWRTAGRFLYARRVRKVRAAR